MLVLSRRTDEQIVINGNIIITLVEAGAGRARIGITAPKSVPVHRREVFDQIVQAAAAEPLQARTG